MATKFKVDLSAVGPHEARVLSTTLAQTRILLKKLLTRLANCVAQSKAIREGTAMNVEAQMEEVSKEAQSIRRELETLSWRFIGMLLPSARSGEPPVTLLGALFENEELFTHLTGKRFARPGFDANWLQQLKDMVVVGYRNVTPLFAQLCYVTKSGLLIAVEDKDGVTDTGSLPSAASLAGNPIGPHPISGPFESGPTGRKPFEDEVPKRRSVRFERAEEKEAVSARDDKGKTQAVPPPPDPFGGLSMKTKTSTRTGTSTNPRLRRRKQFE